MIKEQVADIIQRHDDWGYMVASCKDLSKDMSAREVRASYVREAQEILELLAPYLLTKDEARCISTDIKCHDENGKTCPLLAKPKCQSVLESSQAKLKLIQEEDSE